MMYSTSHLLEQQQMQVTTMIIRDTLQWVSQPFPLITLIDKSVDGGSDALQLPAINSGHKGSPFKGFLDISIVH